MSTIFLTGATGFLGSHIAEALVAGGHHVTCSVRSSSDTRWLDPLDVECVTLDLGDDDVSGRDSSFAPALARAETVIHCGALTRARNEAEFTRVNATGTGRLVRAAAEAGVARFVLISSLSARGPDDAAGPISPYGRSKAAAEAALAAHRGSMSAVILRPGGVYGPRDPDLVPLFKLVSRGWTVVPRSSTPLQPIFVDDVVSAVLRAIVAPEAGRPLAVVGEGVYDWNELAAALQAAVGRAGRVVRVPPRLFWTAGLLSELAARVTRRPPAMDRRRARDMSVHSWTSELETTRRALDPWRPETSIHEGMARTAAWYGEVGWL